MPGQAVVTIGECSWSVGIASSAAELLSGLSGVASIPVDTGMLFDMGSEQAQIAINMADMQFGLDIAFLNSNNEVVGILHGVEPEETAAFDTGNGQGARYFMEVNAGEMDDISVGDIAVIEVAEGEPSPTPSTLDLNAIISPLITIMIIGMMMKMMTSATGG